MNYNKFFYYSELQLVFITVNYNKLFITVNSIQRQITRYQSNVWSTVVFLV